MTRGIVLLAVAIGLALAGSLCADENVREVQDRLRDGGFYSGEIDSAYSSELSAALTRYQIRNGLPITGQLDVETSKALGAKPAVGPSTAATEQSSSETWRRLRRGAEQRRSASARRSEIAATEARETSSPTAEETGNNTEMQQRSALAAKARTSSESTEPVSAPPATTRTSSKTTEPTSALPAAALDTSSSAAGVSTERLRDYVAAFILAGLDRNVGAEVEFFADRVEYYDSGLINRENIREDLKGYDERWPERHFWFAGDITVELQRDNRVRVTFPLGFKLRNGNRTVNGKVDKSLVLEAAGDDLQIVAVNERKAK